MQAIPAIFGRLILGLGQLTLQVRAQQAMQ
jgi:hypothetical protein